MIRPHHAAKKISPIRDRVAVAIAVALGFVVQWTIDTPSPPIAQVQARIEAARGRPAPPLQPLPRMHPVEAHSWSMARDPFVDLATP